MATDCLSCEFISISPDDLDLVDASEACRILGGEASPIDRSTLYRGVAAGRYPRPIKMGPGLSRWAKGELRAVIRERLAARDLGGEAA